MGRDVACDPEENGDSNDNKEAMSSNTRDEEDVSMSRRAKSRHILLMLRQFATEKKKSM